MAILAGDQRGWAVLPVGCDAFGPVSYYVTKISYPSSFGQNWSTQQSYDLFTTVKLLVLSDDPARVMRLRICEDEWTSTTIETCAQHLYTLNI